MKINPVHALFDPERHLEFGFDGWNPIQAQDWLESWADAALSHWKNTRSFPLHPRDQEAKAENGPKQSLYFGAAGVWLALAQMQNAGLLSLPEKLTDIFAEIDENYQNAPDTGKAVPSWFLGESGLLSMRLLSEIEAHPDFNLKESKLSQRLEDAIRRNFNNPTREALWGAPGTQLAALLFWEISGDEHWANLFRESVEILWKSWNYNEEIGTHIWEQDMYGQRSKYVGAGHGWAGNLYPLWRGYNLLDSHKQNLLRERTLSGLKNSGVHIVVSGITHANWPGCFDGEPKMVMQWCHGAPGIITSLSYADLPEITPSLVSGGHSIVTAGPLKKGVALCHGTDGNAMALLELHRRTGQFVWHSYAQRFAQFALSQSEQHKAEHGDWRYSLWTGDAGLACCLLACLKPNENKNQGFMPGLDRFWMDTSKKLISKENKNTL